MGQCLGGSIRGAQSSGAVDSVSAKQRSICVQTRQLDRAASPLRAPPPPESTASGDLREGKAALVLRMSWTKASSRHGVRAGMTPPLGLEKGGPTIRCRGQWE